MKIFLNIFLFLFTNHFLSSQVGIATENPIGIFNVDSSGDNDLTPTTTQKLNDFIIMPDGKVGIGITPNFNFHSKGTVSFPDVKDKLLNKNNSSIIGIDKNNGELGIFNNVPSAVLGFRSNYNSYNNSNDAGPAFFELTNLSSTTINDGVSISNGGTDGTLNEDYFVLSPGKYKIESNFSFAVSVPLGACLFDVYQTSNLTPSSYNVIYTSYFMTNSSTNTQAANTFAFFEINEESRIRLGLRHTTGSIIIRRPLISNPPTNTFSFLVTKLD